MDTKHISWKQAAIILVLVFGGAIGLAGWLAESSPAPQTRDTRKQAIYCARDQVRLLLKAPSTAKFPRTSDDQVTDMGGGTFEIKSYVDAQNSFGAMIRTRYTCSVKSNPASDACETACQLLE